MVNPQLIKKDEQIHKFELFLSVTCKLMETVICVISFVSLENLVLVFIFTFVNETKKSRLSIQD